MSAVMMMITLPSPLALLACAMLVGGGARDLMGAATSAAGSGARFTKSFLNSVHALDPVAMLHEETVHRKEQHGRDKTNAKFRQADACQHWSQEPAWSLCCIVFCMGLCTWQHALSQ